MRFRNLLVSLLFFSLQAQASLSNGLLVRLQLDEGSGTSAADETGNFTCTLDLASWTASIGGRGPVYTSTETNEISCGSVSVAVGPDATFAFWMYKTGEPNASNYIITKYNTVASGRSFRVYVESDQDIALQASDDGTGNEIQQVTDNIVDNTWTHVILTFDNGVFNGYYDNTLKIDDGDFTITDIFDSTTNSVFCIGNSNCGVDSGFVGHLSELAIWDRVLTATERTAVFNDNWGIVPISVDHARRRRP